MENCILKNVENCSDHIITQKILFIMFNRYRETVKNMEFS